MRPSTRSWLPVLLCAAALLPGCGYFGYYKHRPAEHASPEEAARVQFPPSLEGGVRLTGAQLKALQVAMDDYRPPGLRPEKLQPPDSCLARWEYIQTTVLQVSDTLFFVDFTPDLRACGPGYIVLDAGATYAVDGQGHILGRE